MTTIARGIVMNKEYLIAKAALCSNLAQEQLTNGEVEEGVQNIF